MQDPKPPAGENSPGDRVARCLTWLEENPHAELQTRACFAVVVACGGDESKPIRFADVAEVLGEPVEDVLDALMALQGPPSRKVQAGDVSIGEEMLIYADTSGDLDDPSFEPVWFEVTGIHGNSDEVTFYSTGDGCAGRVTIGTFLLDAEVTVR